uniref:RING-type domain-containing protein n=1 Tax=Macrostomum lignano TaxID=282301 RepID=A0A1I8IFZ2_9PLAT
MRRGRDSSRASSVSNPVSPLAVPPSPRAVSDSVTLVDELASFLSGRPDATSAEFYVHLRASQSTRQLFPDPTCRGPDGWRAWLPPGNASNPNSHLLFEFFKSARGGDLTCHDLIGLLERWHRLMRLTGGPEHWLADTPQRFAARLNEHFSRHSDHRCRQNITVDDVLFLYRRFGIVPSETNPDDAFRRMVRAISWASTQFSCLFLRFREPAFSLLDLCQFCRINQPVCTAKYDTVCALAAARVETHAIRLCEICSNFIRRQSGPPPHCPCCERSIVRAVQAPLG